MAHKGSNMKSCYAKDNTKNMLNSDSDSSTQLNQILKQLKLDKNLGSAVEKLFNETSDLNKIQSQVILFIKNAIPEKNNLGNSGIIEERLTRGINNISKKFMKNVDKQFDSSFGTIDKKNQKYVLNNEVKSDLEKTIKNWAVYQVYKIMNPKRIAGETHKDNYISNLKFRGQKQAEKYSKNLSENEKKDAQKKVVALKKDSNGRGR